MILQRLGLYKSQEAVYADRSGSCCTGRTQYKSRDLFTQEHARLELELRSLLTGEPLPGVKVRWRLVGVPEGMAVFLRKKADEPNGRSRRQHKRRRDKKPVRPQTGRDGRLAVPVSARHWHSDKSLSEVTSARPGSFGAGGAEYKSYQTAVGFARIEARFNGGQRIAQQVPFIDSLWLWARPVSWPQQFVVGVPREVILEVTGFVGADGTRLAKRRFDGFAPDDFSVQGYGEGSGIGPVFFSSLRPRVEPRNSLEADDMLPHSGCRDDNGVFRCSFAGLSAGAQSAGKMQLKGLFEAREPGAFCLTQKWPSAGVQTFDGDSVRVWWGQAGATLKLPGKGLCSRAQKPGL